MRPSNASVANIGTLDGTECIAVDKTGAVVANKTTMSDIKTYVLASGAGMTAQAKSTGFTAANNYRYICDTTSAGFTATLPASPSVGDYIEFQDAGSTWAAKNLTLDRNSLKINGATANFVCNANDIQVNLTYVSAAYGWHVSLEASVLTAAPHTTGSHSDWPSGVSMTEVGYLDGVTSAIQTQLTADAKKVGDDSQLTRQMLIDCGYTYVDKGNSGTTTQTLDYTAGSHQKITTTGAHTIATSNWPPTGNLGGLLLELVNGASSTITWMTVNWVKSDGTFTTTFSSNGVTLQTSGTDFVFLWSRDAGTTIYGKVVR